MSQDLQNVIDLAWESRATLTATNSPEVRDAVEHVIADLNKGRLRVGGDADLVVFDLSATRDAATYEQPVQYSEGMRQVLVNGQFVVRDGKVVEGAVPGRPVRAPVQP